MVTDTILIDVRSTGTKRVQRSINDIGRAASSTRRTLAFLRSALVVIASVRIFRGLFDLADTFTLMNNKLKQVTATTRELLAVQNALIQVSNETGTELEANVTLFQRLAITTTRLNLTFQELIDLTRGIAQAAIIGGTTTQEFAGAVIQLTQGLGAGALQGQELRAVVEGFLPLAEAIAKELGVATGELIAFSKANEGAVTDVKVIQGVQKALLGFARDFGKTADTFGRAFTRINTSLVVFLGRASAASGTGKFLIDILNGIAENIDKVVIGIIALAGVIAFNLIISQVALLNGRILGLALSFGKAARAAGIFSVLFTPLSALRVALTGVGRAAAFAFTPIILLGKGALLTIVALLNPLKALKLAFTALNVVVRRNPLFLIGTAIVLALVGAFFLFRKQIDSIRESLGSFRDIFNTVVSLIGAAFITIKDNFQLIPAVLAEIGINIVNTFINIFNTVSKRSTDSINSILRFFQNFPANMVKIARSAVDGIANAFSFLFPKFKSIAAFLITPFRLLGDAIKEVFINAINKIIELFNRLKNNRVIVGIVRVLTGGLVDLSELDLKPIENRYEGSAKKIVGFFTGAGEGISTAIKKGLTDVLDVLKTLPTLQFEAFQLEPLENKFIGASRALKEEFLANATEIKAANPFQVMLDTIEKARKAVSGLLEIKLDPVALQGGPSSRGAESSFNRDARAAEALRDQFRGLESSVSPLADFFNRQIKAQNLLNKAEAAGLVTGTRSVEIKKLLAREILGVSNAVTFATEKEEALNVALMDGVINAKEFAAALVDVRIEALETATSIEAGFERGLLQVKKTFMDVASLAENAIVNAFQGAEDALASFVETGKIEFSSLVDSIRKDLIKLAIRQAITAPLAGLLTPVGAKGAGGFLGGLFSGPGGGGGTGSAIASVLGAFFGGGTTPGSTGGEFSSFQRGADFTVGSRTGIGSFSGVDNRLVSFKAQDGERVQVTPKGEGSSERPITLNFNINTPDANSFMATQDQIMTKGLSIAERARRRNG